MACLLLTIILAGIAAPAGAAEPSRATSTRSDYWAYQPVVRPEVPTVQDAEKVQSPIDAFLLARLEEKGLTLSPPAEKRELLRRVKFDLHGLPPTTEEIETFLADTAPDAYVRLIDRLLASPHYGERWGRMWLDVVRFADTAGFNADPLRPLAYKYRDYVIQSFNRDTPYDRFVQEQLAGDELFPEDPQALIATGFLRLPPDESNASNVLLARQDMLNDVTATVGAVFLGQSLGCAQCHNHKFDAIPQKDFYQIQAFFAGIIPVERLPVGDAAAQYEYQQRLAAWEAETDALRSELHELEVAARVKAGHTLRLKFPDVVLQAVDTAPEKRTAFQHQLAFYSERQIVISEKALLAALSPEQQARREELKQQLNEKLAQRPQPPAAIDAMLACDGTETPPTHLLAGGSYNKPLTELSPGFLSAVSLGSEEADSPVIVPPRPGTTGRRATFARWITDPRHPLTARVMVNRIWQGHFGRGIVENANDFGTQTAPPTHPELLDWLAAEFVSPSTGIPGESWSIKRMHRLILFSTAYQQATYRGTADENPPGVTVDGDNRLYWHYPRRRLDAEAIRDSLLAVSGLLETKMFGPGVQPDLPPNYSTREAWKVTPDENERRRRSVYILMKRNLPYPLLDAFDFPDMHESCAQRAETTTAPQALMLLNSEMILDYAQQFASRLLKENPQAVAAPLVQQAYQVAFGRPPTEEEIAGAEAFLSEQEKLIAARLAAGEKILLPPSLPKFLDPPRAAAVVDLCHALMNANEFTYID